MVQFCKFDNVRIIDPNNPDINFIVFHHRFESLVEGCFRVAESYRYENSSKTRFLIDCNGVIQFDGRKRKILI